MGRKKGSRNISNWKDKLSGSEESARNYIQEYIEEHGLLFGMSDVNRQQHIQLYNACRYHGRSDMFREYLPKTSNYPENTWGTWHWKKDEDNLLRYVFPSETLKSKINEYIEENDLDLDEICFTDRTFKPYNNISSSLGVGPIPYNFAIYELYGVNLFDNLVKNPKFISKIKSKDDGEILPNKNLSEFPYCDPIRANNIQTFLEAINNNDPYLLWD